MLGFGRPGHVALHRRDQPREPGVEVVGRVRARPASRDREVRVQHAARDVARVIERAGEQQVDRSGEDLAREDELLAEDVHEVGELGAVLGRHRGQLGAEQLSVDPDLSCSHEPRVDRGLVVGGREVAGAGRRPVEVEPHAHDHRDGCADGDRCYELVARDDEVERAVGEEALVLERLDAGRRDVERGGGRPEDADRATVDDHLGERRAQRPAAVHVGPVRTAPADRHPDRHRFVHDQRDRVRGPLDGLHELDVVDEEVGVGRARGPG